MTSRAASTYTTLVSEGSMRERALQSMGTELKEIALRWADEEQQLDLSELAIRYRWAKDIKKVDEQRQLYGNNAAETLRSLRVDPYFNLLHYRTVATFIDDEFFADVLAFNKTRQARKGRITWSHLIAFSRVASGEARQSLFEQCKAELWCVATLETRANEAIGGDPAKSTTEIRQSGAGSIAKRATKIVGQLTTHTWKFVGDEFNESLTKLRPSEREATFESLDNAKTALSECVVHLGVIVQAINEAMKGINSKRADFSEEDAQDESGPATAPQQAQAGAKKQKTLFASPNAASSPSTTEAIHSQEAKEKLKKKPLTTTPEIAPKRKEGVQPAPSAQQPQVVPKNSNTARTLPTASGASSAAETNRPQRKRRKFKRRPNPNSPGSAASGVTLKT